MRFLLEIWIVPKEAVSIRQTKGQYWSYGILAAAVVMIAVIIFAMDMYAHAYFSLFIYWHYLEQLKHGSNGILPERQKNMW